MTEILTALYLALTEAAGPGGLAKADGAIRHLLNDGAITDPGAVAFLSSLLEAGEGYH